MKKKLTTFILLFLLLGSSGTGAFLLTYESGPKTYEATFYNESAIVATVETEFDKAVSAPEDPTKTGYEFKGWFEDDQTFYVPFDVKKAYNKDVSFYAKWKKEEQNPGEIPPSQQPGQPVVSIYKVKFFDVITGEQIGETQNVKEGEGAIAPVVPEKYGYVFDKWSRDFNNIKKNTEIFAYYKPGLFDIVFIYGLNGEKQKTVSDVEFLSAISDPTIKDLQEEKWIFDGWYFDENGNNKYDQDDKQAVMGTSVLETEGATLVAKYKRGPVKGVNIIATNSDIELVDGVYYSTYGDDINLESQFIKEGEYNYTYLWSITRFVDGVQQGDVVNFTNKNVAFTAYEAPEEELAALAEEVEKDIAYHYNTKAGDYQITLKITQFDANGNFVTEGTAQVFELTIDKAKVTLTVPNGYRTYGDGDETIKFVDGDVFGEYEQESEDFRDFIKIKGLLTKDRSFFIKNKSKLKVSTNTDEFSNWTKDKNLYDYLITVKNFDKCFDLENYAVSVQPGKLKINQRPINFVVDNKTIAYGYELVTPTAKIADGFTYAGSETKKPHTLADVLSLTWSGNKNAGSYKITASIKNNNYKLAGEMPTAIYKITPRVIEVVLKEQKNIYNGTETFDIKETAQFYEIKTADNKEHDFDKNKIISITKQTAGSDVGKYDLIATIVNNNYTFADGKTFVQADVFEVLRREIQVDANDKTNVYNKGVHTYTYSSNIELGEETTHIISFTYTTSGADVGNYALNATINGEDFAQLGSSKIVVSGLSFSDGTNAVKANNYSIVYNLSAEITPADLKVEATKLSTEYNAQAQYPTLSILGVDDCDEQNIAKLSYSNDKTSWSTESEFTASEFAMKNAGVHKVYVKVVVPNYKEFVTEQQIFTITKAPLSVKVNDISVVYGDTISLDKYTFTCISPFKGQDNVENSIIVPDNKKSYFVLSQEHSVKTSAGTKIEVDLEVNKTGKLYAPNYEISVIKGTISVEKRTVIATLRNIEGFYGSASNVIIDKITNLPTATGDTVLALGLTLSISREGKEYTKESFVGQYDIKVKEVKNSNYIVEIDQTTKVYNVKQLAITGTVSGSGEFNGEKHSLNAYEVFKNDQSIINGHQVSGVVTTGNSFAGIYKAEDGKFDYSKVIITDKTGQDVTSNYAISLTGSYQITNANFKAPSIMVGDILVSNPENGWSFEYDGKEHIITVVPSEVAGGETAEVMYSADGLNYSKDLIKIKNAGIYEIYYKIKAANHEEYQPQQSFDIEIKQKQLTIGLEPFDAVIYGQACPEFKFDYSGFIDGENENVLSRKPIINCEYVAGADVKEGGYPITISGAEALNYKIEYAKGKVLTVLKKELVLTGFVKFDNVVYDAQDHYAVITSDEINQLSAKGSITIEYSVDGVNYSSEKIAFRNAVKDKTLFVRIKESTNYTGATTYIKVTVEPKELTASFVETNEQAIDFGNQNNINLNVKIDGFYGNEGAGILNSVTYFVSYNNDTVAYPYDHSYVLNASATPYVFTIDGVQVANYTIDYTSAQTNVKVNKQQLVASIVTNADSYYGDLPETVIANHQIVYTYNDANVDSPEGIQLSLETVYKQGNNANYEYKISFASQGTRESTNYKVIREETKSFYLKARVGTVTVVSATQIYGVQSSDNYDVSVEFENGFVQPQGIEAGIIATIEKQSASTFALRNSSANGNGYGVGNYSINVTYTNANYVLTLISKNAEGNTIDEKPLVALESVQSSSELKVTPKTITVQIDNTTSIYGQDTGLDGAFSIVEMLPYGDQKEDLQFELKMFGELVDQYPVSAQYNNENYIVNLVNKSDSSKNVTISSGDLAQNVAIHEIKQQQVNFSVSTDASENKYIYGQYPAFNLTSDVELLEVLQGTLTISKAGMEDVVIDLSTDIKDAFNCTKLLSIGTYKVTINFADTQNYDVVGIVETAFEVKPREVNVHVTGSKIYNSNNIFNAFTQVSITAADENSIADQLYVTGAVVATGMGASETAYGVESSSLELTGNNCENYTIVDVSGELTITARKIKIAVSGNSIVYGDVNAEQMSSQLTAVYKLGDGFVSGDNINSLNIKFAVDIADAAKTEGYANVDSYNIEIASWNNTNYKVDFVEEHVFTVQQRQVAISGFKTTTSEFGSEITSLDANKFTVTTANLDNTTILSQAISSISYTLKDELTSSSDAKFYNVVATINNGNFKFVVNGADTNQSIVENAYQIQPKSIIIDLTQTVVYNGEKTRQFIIEKDSSDVDLGFTLTINATTSSANVDAYIYGADQNKVTISTVEISSGHKLANYDIDYVGTITVDPCQISIVKNANALLTSVYGSDVMSAEQIKAQYTINKVSQIDLNSDATSALNNAVVFSIDNLPEQGYANADTYNVFVTLADNNFVFQNEFAFGDDNVDEQAYEITQQTLSITINKAVLYQQENSYSYDSKNDSQYVATGLVGNHVSRVQFALEDVSAGRYVYNGENSGEFKSFSVDVNDENGESVKGNYQLQLDIVYIVSEIDFEINNEVGKTEFEYDGTAHKAIPVTINGNAEDYEITYQWDDGEYTTEAPKFIDVTTKVVNFKIVKKSDGVWIEGFATVKVLPRKITVELNNEKTYGDEISTTITSADRLVDDHSISVTVIPSDRIVKYDQENVIAYVYNTTVSTPVTDGFETPVATITNGDTKNYEITYNLVTKIVPKPIDVNITAQSKVYGDAETSLATATWDNSLDLVASDIKFERADSKNVNVGDYQITATNTNKNYNVTFVWANDNDQTYSITPRQITVTKYIITTSVYGATIATPVADSFVVSAGDVNENIVNDAKSSLIFLAVDGKLNSLAELANKPTVATYDVKVTLKANSNFMFADNADYIVVYDAYQITKATLQVKVNATREFAERNGQISIENMTDYDECLVWIDGKVDEDYNAIRDLISIEEIDDEQGATYTLGKHTGVVKVSLSSNYDFENYVLQPVNGDLTITPKTVTIDLSTVTYNDYDEVYDGTNVREVQITKYSNGNDLGFNLTAKISLDKADIGTYNIDNDDVIDVTLSGNSYDKENYKFTLLESAIEIIPRNITVSLPESTSKYYNGEVFTATLTQNNITSEKGLAKDHSIAVTVSTKYVDVNVDGTGNVIAYGTEDFEIGIPVIKKGEETIANKNYNIEYVLFATINRQALTATIVANDETSYYGDTKEEVLGRYSIAYSYINDVYGNNGELLYAKGDLLSGTPDGISLSVYTTYEWGKDIGSYDLVYFDHNESKVVNDDEAVKSTNYVVAVAKNTVQIKQRALDVKVADSGHTYGQENSDLSSAISYDRQGELPDPKITLSIVENASTFAMRSSAKPLSAGKYALNVYYTNANYAITLVGDVEGEEGQSIEPTKEGEEPVPVIVTVAEYVVTAQEIELSVETGDITYGEKPTFRFSTDVELIVGNIFQGTITISTGNVVAAQGTVTVTSENLACTLESILSAYDGYTVTISNFANDNYEVVDYEGTSFNVDLRPVAVVLTGSKEYDGNAKFESFSSAEITSVAGVANSGKYNNEDINVEGYVTVPYADASDSAYTNITWKNGEEATLTLTNDNYTIVGVSGELTISKKQVYIALNASTVYAGADQNVHQLTFTKDSSNVDLGFTLSITAQTTSGDAGQYYYIEGSDVNDDGDGVVIINSQTISDGDIKNYQFQYSGSITITAQKVKLSVATANITYGQESIFNFVVTDENGNPYTLLDTLTNGSLTISKNGNTVESINNISVSGTKLTCTLEGILNAGDYTVEISNFANGNYKVVGYEGTSFNVAQRKVNVNLVGSKYYDGNGKFESFSSAEITSVEGVENSGKYNNEDINVEGYVTVPYADASDSAYTNITWKNGEEATLTLTNDNYTIVGVSGELTISKATITVGFTSGEENINYGAQPTLALSYTGIVSDEEDEVKEQITATLLCNREVYTATLLGVKDGGYTFTIDSSTISVNNNNYTIEAVQESTQKLFAKSVVTIKPLDVTVKIDSDNKPTSIYGEVLNDDISAKVAEKAIISFNTNNMSAKTATIIESEIKRAIKYSVNINNQSLPGDYDISITLNETNYVLKEDTIDQGYVIEGISVIVKVHGEKVYDATKAFSYDQLQIISAVNEKTGETITEELSFSDESFGSVTAADSNVAEKADFSNALGIENLVLTNSKYKVAGFSVYSDYTIVPLAVRFVYSSVQKTYDGTNIVEVDYDQKYNDQSVVTRQVAGYDRVKDPKTGIYHLIATSEYTDDDNNTIPGLSNNCGKTITLTFNYGTKDLKDVADSISLGENYVLGNHALLDVGVLARDEFRDSLNEDGQSNYIFDAEVLQLTISKATINITADDVDAAQQYNGSAAQISISNRGTGVTDQTVSFTATTKGSDVKAGGYVANGAIDDLSTIANGCEVGEFIISDLSISGGDLSNYRISFIDFAITISPKAVSVTFNGFNGAGHPFGMNPMDSGEIKETATINGDVDDKARESISFSPVADKTSVVGSYNITASINNNPNFTFVAEDGSYSQTATFKNAYVVSKATAYIVGKNWSDNTTNVYNLAEMDYDTNIFDAIGLVYQTVDANGNAIYAMATADQLAKEKDTSTGEAKEGAGFYYNNDVIDVSVGGSYYVTFNGQFFVNFNVETAYLYLKVKTVAVGGFNGKLYTFEDALKTATSGEIFVKYPTQTASSAIADVLYPEKDEHIDGYNDYTTIKSGVTLNLPRDEDGNVGYYKNNKIVDCQGYKGTADADEAANRNVYLLLNEEFVLNNNGNINIGGLLGAGGAGSINGITVGKYAEITMGDGSQIINNKGSALSVYGYIKEQNANTTTNPSSIIVNDGATIWAPFTVYDFRGGSNTTAAAKENVVPFLIYDVSNVHPLLTIKYGGSFRVWADLYASSQHNTTDKGHMVAKSGSNGLFILEENATINFKYRSNQGKVQIGYSGSAGHTVININGDVSVGSMTLEVVGTKVDTKNFYFGVSYKHRINVQKGKLTVPSEIKIKLLPGSEITVDKDAEIHVVGSVTAYSSYKDRFPGGARYYTADGVNYTGVVPASAVAKITVNGTFSVSGSFGGKIYTTNPTKDEAKIIFESGATTVVTTVEVTGTTGSYFSTTAETESVTTRARANVADAEKDLIKTTYKGVGDGTFWSTEENVNVKLISNEDGKTVLGTVQVKQGSAISPDAIKNALPSYIISSVLDSYNGNTYNYSTLIYNTANVYINATATNISVILKYNEKEETVGVVYGSGGYKVPNADAGDGYVYVWFDENGNYFIGNRVTSGLSNGMILNGIKYQEITSLDGLTLSMDCKNVLLSGINLTEIDYEFETIPTYGEPTVSYKSPFANAGITRILIEGNCTGKLQGKVENATTSTTSVCGSTTYYQHFFTGVFAGNGMIENVIFEDGEYIIENYSFANTNLSITDVGTKIVNKNSKTTLTEEHFKKNSEKGQDSSYGGGWIIDVCGGGPGDGFWFILLPAFALLLAGGYLSLRSNKKQTN